MIEGLGTRLIPLAICGNSLDPRPLTGSWPGNEATKFARETFLASFPCRLLRNAPAQLVHVSERGSFVQYQSAFQSEFYYRVGLEANTPFKCMKWGDSTAT